MFPSTCGSSRQESLINRLGICIISSLFFVFSCPNTFAQTTDQTLPHIDSTLTHFVLQKDDPSSNVIGSETEGLVSIEPQIIKFDFAFDRKNVSEITLDVRYIEVIDGPVHGKSISDEWVTCQTGSSPDELLAATLGSCFNIPLSSDRTFIRVGVNTSELPIKNQTGEFDLFAVVLDLDGEILSGTGDKLLRLKVSSGSQIPTFFRISIVEFNIWIFSIIGIVLYAMFWLVIRFFLKEKFSKPLLFSLLGSGAALGIVFDSSFIIRIFISLLAFGFNFALVWSLLGRIPLKGFSSITSTSIFCFYLILILQIYLYDLVHKFF